MTRKLITSMLVLFALALSNVWAAPTEPPTISLDNNEIEENNAEGELIGNLSYVPSDPNSSVAYSLGGEDAGSFSVSDSSLYAGQTSFDYEAANAFQIEITATEIPGGAKETKSFTINIIDVNEAPTGLNLSGTSITENASSGTLLGFISAEDPDGKPEFAFYQFTVVDSLYFYVDQGKLKNSQPLDYEQNNFHTIQIQAVDTNKPANTITETFTITVSDTNDAPENLTLDESAVEENLDSPAMVGSFSVEDDDPNQTHSYSFVSGFDESSFTIEGTSLKTAESFNYEEKSSYTVKVECTDSGSPAESVAKEFEILIEDVNEKPVNLAIDNSSIDENEPAGTLVGDFTVDDEDASQTHSYSFVSGFDESSFTIEGSSLKTAESFNYEEKSSYTVKVECTDSGSPAKSVTEEFEITIEDVNDKPVNLAIDNSSIDENEPAGTLVGDFTVDDEDASQTHSYSFVSGLDESSFTIEGSSLKTAESFNYEEKSSYTVKVECTDSGSPAKSVTEEFEITIEDVNDKPVNLAIDNSSIDENEPAGTLVGDFTVDDEDPNQTHSYSFVSGLDESSFAIEGTSLKTAESFNYEEKSSYTVKVECTDSGSPAKSVTEEFEITIQDVNDKPVIDQGEQLAHESYDYVVNYINLSASDEDNTTNELNWEISQDPNSNGNVSVKEDDGRITLRSKDGYQGDYSFTVKVEDTEGGADTITVNETVLAPIEISTSAQLASVGQNAQMPLNGSYTLTNDMNLESLEDFEIASDPNSPFLGVFNGNRKALLNYKPQDPASSSIFGVIGKDALVRDLNVEDVQASFGSVDSAPLFADTIQGQVKRCGLTGRLSAENVSGVLAPFADVIGEGSVLEDVYVAVDIEAMSSGAVSGFVRSFEGALTRCFIYGPASGSDIYAFNSEGSADFTNAYFNNEYFSCSQAVGLGSIEFQDEANFAGFDFEGPESPNAIWAINPDYPVFAWRKYSGGGTGNPEDPYQIVDPEDAVAFFEDKNNTSSSYELKDDIDLSGLDTEPIGTVSEPFTGVFDGNGYTLVNPEYTSDDEFAGLFGVVQGGTIKGVTIENPSKPSEADFEGISYYGGLCSYLYSGTIKDCHVIMDSDKTLEINIPNRENLICYAGLLCGSNYGGTIEQSSVSGKLLLNIEGQGYEPKVTVGGFVGSCDYSSTITDCYAKSAVEISADPNLSAENAGLFAGENYGNVNNCYSAVWQGAQVPNLYGFAEVNFGSLSNVYAPPQLSALGLGSFEGLTSQDLTGVLPKTWDDEVWILNTEDTPSLRSEGYPCDYNFDEIVNILDYIEFVNLWVEGSQRADLNEDNTINYEDLTVFMTYWLDSK
ncbi:cadherin domain-containing protein [Sedimentisphaera salicampi]|uniref:Cadherin domain protein n=1 Tax=Sedimentisphaera salicampi TaxID=1941349 RepID=A0A1W6LME3_9BACT|nr:cadherin domain-containing protein [Sedimentisphaera salicampi]ARN56914.1 Cadherin domain protein [Sedimentisphaera salicampi]